MPESLRTFQSCCWIWPEAQKRLLDNRQRVNGLDAADVDAAHFTALAVDPERELKVSEKLLAGCAGIKAEALVEACEERLALAAVPCLDRQKRALALDD